MFLYITASLVLLLIAYFVTRPGGVRGVIMAYRVGYYVSQRLWSEIEQCGANVTKMDVQIPISNRWFSIDPRDEEDQLIVNLVANNVCREFKQDNLLGSVMFSEEKTTFRFRSKSSLDLEGGATCH